MINFEINKLFLWYDEYFRDLPWRNTNDPYKVWLSEIILQQTRVEQGLPYYEKFVDTYPTVHELANASLDEVYKIWEGLGYYSRANNLHHTAQYVVNELNGVFPDHYDGLIKLKGIGDYTASAIASFCFNEVKPVLDGNVFRVIARLFDIHEPINKPKTRDVFKEILENIIPYDSPDKFNQAIMEFGAIYCVPSSPDCINCPFVNSCLGYQNNNVNKLPVKLKSKKSRNRYFNYLVQVTNGKVKLTKRGEKDIWRNLYEFPLIESKVFFEEDKIKNISHKSISTSYKHILSHQNIFAKFYLINEDQEIEGKFVNLTEIQNYGLHRLMGKFLEETNWL